MHRDSELFRAYYFKTLQHLVWMVSSTSLLFNSKRSLSSRFSSTVTSEPLRSMRWGLSVQPASASIITMKSLKSTGLAMHPFKSRSPVPITAIFVREILLRNRTAKIENLYWESERQFSNSHSSQPPPSGGDERFLKEGIESWITFLEPPCKSWNPYSPILNVQNKFPKSMDSGQLKQNCREE